MDFFCERYYSFSYFKSPKGYMRGEEDYDSKIGKKRGSCILLTIPVEIRRLGSSF